MSGESSSASQEFVGRWIGNTLPAALLGHGTRNIFFYLIHCHCTVYCPSC